jgi:bisphosphoglycerate-independent phosphoglycerate mutase (AlkP superfamily)
MQVASSPSIQLHDFLIYISTSVHDGWGVATTPGLEGNAIEAGDTTNMDTIGKDHSHRLLAAHGTAVGLSDGLMGNSEVGFVVSSTRMACE